MAITIPEVKIVGQQPSPYNQVPNLGPSPSQAAAQGDAASAGATNQITQAYGDLNQAAQQAAPYPGGTPYGSIRSTPQEATTDALNNIELQKNLEGKKGDIEQYKQLQLAQKEAQAAQEKIQQAQDFADLQATNFEQYNAAHNKTQEAYDKFKSAAGNLKDPNNQFFEDSLLGQGGRISGAVAAFASGLGSGLTGHGGNPFLDYLNKQIDNNFQAHKTNVEDLYKSAVAAGQIEDNIESHNRFLNEAKLKSYDLSSAHIQNELKQIEANSANPLAKITAQQGIAALDQQGIAMRQKLSEHEAQKAAAGLAAQRARQKEAQAAFDKSLERHKDLPAEDARLEAVKDLIASGADRSVVIPFVKAIGGGYNTEKGKEGYVLPTSSTPKIDENGVPVRDPATGKIYTPEQREKVKERLDSKNTYDNLLKDVDKFSSESNVIAPSLIQSGETKDDKGNVITSNRQQTSAVQEEYKAFVLRAAAEIYKAQNGGVEPKNQEIVKELAAPYLPGVGYESKETTKKRIDQLKHDLQANVGTKFGQQVSSEEPKDEIPKSIEPLKPPTAKQVQNIVSPKGVLLQNLQGQLGYVPKEQVDIAIKKGYTYPAHESK